VPLPLQYFALLYTIPALVTLIAVPTVLLAYVSDANIASTPNASTHLGQLLAIGNYSFVDIIDSSTVIRAQVVQNYYVLALAIVDYCLIVCFALLTWRHLRRTLLLAQLTPARRALERQITLAMCLQAGIPIVAQYTPKLLLAFAFFTNNATMGLELSAYQTLEYALMPMVNPLVNICMISAYRRGVYAMVRSVVMPKKAQAHIPVTAGLVCGVT
jgi:Serpentine type 7TM GPCR chemoreceptor Str